MEAINKYDGKRDRDSFFISTFGGIWPSGQIIVCPEFLKEILKLFSLFFLLF